jgi:hypothetical protein
MYPKIFFLHHSKLIKLYMAKGVLKNMDLNNIDPKHGRSCRKQQPQRKNEQRIQEEMGGNREEIDIEEDEVKTYELKRKQI